jgi:Fic family protein
MCLFPSQAELLHTIDQACGGGGVAAIDAEHGVLSDPEARTRFLIRSLMDEAIESSIIEGAATTRELAIELLRSGRPPVTKDERMVANNYAAMLQIKGWLDRPLSSGMLCELQKTLTQSTLRSEDQAGRFRRADEPIAVTDERTGETIFTPPPAGELSKRIEALCRFANDPHAGPEFIHPVVKACILHFMVGYEHPFVDGNGRTARAVFHWFALRNGYRVFEFMAISQLIRAAIAKYPQAYVDSELDDGDLTYFILYKLGIVTRSLERLSEHITEEEAKIERSLRLVRLDRHLNLRQRLLLEHALRHPKTIYTAKSHANSNNITAMTARTDLEYLRKRKLFGTYKVGRAVQYILSPELPRRLAKLDR